MKKIRRKVAFVLAVVMLLGSSLTTHAQGAEKEVKKTNQEIANEMLDAFVESVKNNTFVEPRWQNTLILEFGFSVSAGTASVYLDVTGRTGVDEIYATVVLSRYNSYTGLYDHVHTFPTQHAYGRLMSYYDTHFPMAAGQRYNATVSVIVFKDGQPEQIQSVRSYDY